MKNIRSRNIEARFLNDDDYACEIVKWYPNSFYGHEDEYEMDDFGMYVKKNPKHETCTTRVSPSCFKHPESCYVICFITNSDEPDVVSVGNRPWELGLLDMEDFDFVRNRAMQMISKCQ